MRYTLLELVQRVLESMESDEVSSISETPESISVTNIIKECYFDIVGDISMDEQEGLFKLDSSGDNNLPCLMYIPSIASRLQWLQYNKGPLNFPEYRDVRYVTNEEYIYYQVGYDPDNTHIIQMTIPLNGSNFIFNVKTDAYPTYYTIFDERSVVFDAYSAVDETTLSQARTLAFGSINAGFEFRNDWVPDIDPRQFQLLLQDAKQTAFTELKQAQNPLAEKKYRRNKILAQKNKSDNDPTSGNQSHASFGRRGSGFDVMKQAMRRGR